MFRFLGEIFKRNGMVRRSCSAGEHAASLLGKRQIGGPLSSHQIGRKAGVVVNPLQVLAGSPAWKLQRDPLRSNSPTNVDGYAFERRVFNLFISTLLPKESSWQTKKRTTVALSLPATRRRPSRPTRRTRTAWRPPTRRRRQPRTCRSPRAPRGSPHPLGVILVVLVHN